MSLQIKLKSDRKYDDNNEQPRNIEFIEFTFLVSVNRVPVPNQPKYIEEIIKIGAKRYYEDPLTIILCFIYKNIDISTSSALKMAKELVKNDSSLRNFNNFY